MTNVQTFISEKPMINPVFQESVQRYQHEVKNKEITVKAERSALFKLMF